MTSKSFFIAILIAMLSFSPYIHDSGLFDGMEGFSGFSSLRLGMWVISMFVVGLGGWIFAFMNSRGKSYRFVMLAPIFMMSFQLAIYLFDSRDTSTNDFTTKVLINLLLLILLIVMYYREKNKRDD